jgi:hypothetical protein
LNRAASSDLNLGALLGDFRLLLLLFIFLRVLLLLVYMPLIGSGIERGISVGGDFFTYFQLSSFVREGLLPFRDWWSEFPPIPHALTTFVFLFSREQYTSFAMLFGMLMLAFDVGSLVLLRDIGRRLYGANTGMALAWVYAVTFAPLVFIWWNFEPMVAFFLLLGTRALIAKRDGRAAVWAGVGGLVKFTPLLLLGAVWRFRRPQAALRWTIAVLAIFGVVYGILYIQFPGNTAASLLAQFNKASYQTVWALLDGNYRTGNFGTAFERLDVANAYTLNGSPSVVPGVVRLGAAALVGLFVFLRTRRFDNKGLLAFMTITLLIFFLQAQGWSPQWLAQIIPLVLLCFPTRYGVMTVLMLSLVVFIEYPFLWLRTGDTGGVMSGALLQPFALLVVGRTAILAGICVALYRVLRQHPIPES